MKCNRWRLMVCLLIPVAVQPAAAAQGEENVPPLRPPAVPLVTHDPYFSIWSRTDRLYDSWPTHWTGKVQALCSMVRIDGKPYRLMGLAPPHVPPLQQKGVSVSPTTTRYSFGNHRVRVGLAFLTPALPDDLEVLSRPATYLIWTASSLDGKDHKVDVYFDCSGEVAVNEPGQTVVWGRENLPTLQVLRIGSEDQKVLNARGDDRRIDWGYAYIAMPKENEGHQAIVGDSIAREAFAAGKELPAQDDAQMPRPANERWPVLANTFSLGNVGAVAASHKTMIVAYDDLYSIDYMGQKLRPYWRRNGMSAADMLQAAARDCERLVERTGQLDLRLQKALREAGGQEYARIGALAYRQCLAANKLCADANGRPLLFPKENFSNGCIGTVDVIYPMAPLFLLLGADLSKAMLVPVLQYGNSPRWKFPFAPHDLGTYPLATGQVYGGGERTEKDQMPVEESANLILLLAALARAEGNADFAGKYWPAVTRWAEYLRSKGYDPENQLCTDDFAGHLAHNCNLSVKAILALEAYSRLADMRGIKDQAEAYDRLAREFAARWVKEADDGDHYRLTFDRPGTWSQKYNMVWDRILGYHLFPDEVARKEMAYYRGVQGKYGLPLDGRNTYTKLDWITWTACLTGSRDDFAALIAPVYRFLNETPDRVPMTDWYQTHNARHVGFVARPVVGGVFMKLLDDPAVWKEWFSAGAAGKGNWAGWPGR
jgi:Domain of unknown function (DUF4965)/Domain of unknown function (DUF5127)/Domain of unknown function (DUF1793)/Domain of unknown function (DUF4964)